MEISDFFTVMVEKTASDVYLTVASPPMYRIEGVIQPIGEHRFTPQELETLAKSILNERQWQEFNEQMEMNLAMSQPMLRRLRVNVFSQRGSVIMVVRRVKVEILSINEMGLPSNLQ
ncbi:MAG: type IV pili twitching motility protein PilT, partial [Candidatus Binatia bacterium]